MVRPTLRRKRRRDIRRQWAQFGAVAVTLFLGVALYGASSDAYRNLGASYRELYARLRFADLTVTGGPVDALARSALADGADAQIRTVADVPFEVGGRKLLGRVVGMPPSGQPAVDRVMVLSGTGLDPSDPTGVLVEQHMASEFHLEPGDRVRVLGPSGWAQVTVRGVAASPEYLWPARSRQEVLAPPGSFGVLFVPATFAAAVAPPGTPRQVVVYAGPAAAPAIASLAATARAGGALDVQLQADQPSNAALLEDVQGFGQLALLFPILFLSAAAMAAYVLLGRIVRSQRGQIGMLAANGASSRTIFRAYLGYGWIVGLVGGVAGAVAGLALADAITRQYTAAISVPITVVSFTPVTPLVGVAIAVAAAVVAAAAPARAAARVEPAEAMRPPVPRGAARASRLERIPGLRDLAPRWKLAVRDIGRNRRRTLSTILGVVLSLVLVLVSWGMLDTTQILLARQFGEIQRQDAQVYFSRGGATTPDLDALRRVSGVAAVEPAAELDASLANGNGVYATSLLGLVPDTTMHGFVGPDGTNLSLPSDGLLVGSALRSTLGLAAGDDLVVRSPAFAEPVRTRVAGFVDEPFGTFAYAVLPWVEEVAGNRGVADTALVRYAPGADASAVQAAISRLPSVSAVVDSKGLQRAARSFMGLFYVFVGVMLLFGGLMSFALMFNTMTANVAERAGEMATLRAAGVRRRTISGILTRENLVVTAIGIVPGLVVGTWFAAFFMGSFSSDLFSFTLQIRASTLIASAVAMLGVALLSQWPGVRAVGRLDVARVVRERSL
ncbi:MAG: FtsX-like permease family protein [Planctomycetaceae bacterium]